MAARDKKLDSFDLIWPDGEVMKDIVFTAKDARANPTVQQVTDGKPSGTFYRVKLTSICFRAANTRDCYTRFAGGDLWLLVFMEDWARG